MTRFTRFAFAVVAVACLAMTGCGGGASKDKLVGEWDGEMKFDEAAMKADMKKKTPDAKDSDIEKDINDGKEIFKKAKFNLKLNADGTAAMKMELDLGLPPGMEAKKDDEKKGKWSVVSTSGKTMVVKMDLEGEKSGKDATITFTDDNTFEMKPQGEGSEKMPPGMSMVFKRKK